MDYYLAVEKIYPGGVDFNPACFDFTEAEARANLLWRDPRPMPDSAALVSALAEADKDAQIKVKYDLMVKDIYDSLESTFGTRNDVSAAASASTWEAMLKRPANYVDATMGLNTEADVTAYANSKIIAADAYGSYRLKRINQFVAEKAAILAS